MAAPSGIKWGSIVNNNTEKAARLGIYTSLSSTNTQTTVSVQVWLWTRYKSIDSTNKTYFNWGSKSASTLVKSNVSVSTTSSEWSTSNQVKLYSTSKTYDRTTSNTTYNCAGKITGLDYIGKTVSYYKSFTIPARASYTVTYNANGGSDVPASQTKWYGTDLTLSSTKPTRTGYTFMGWGTGSGTTTIVSYNAGSTYTTNSAITLYAIWKKDITLTFDSNGGTGQPSSQSATVYNATTSSEFTIPTTQPTRTGYTFKGWGTSSNSVTISYSPGDIITLTSSTTLYAVWQLKTYTITYHGNGGIGVPSSQIKTYGVNLTISTVEPTRSGYKFLGWSTQNNTDTPTYLSGGTITTNANMTLYAVWEQLGIAYINIDGTYRAGKIWVNDYGTWMSGIVFVNDHGTWSQGGI